MRGLKSLGFIAQYRSKKDKRELITHLTDEGHAFFGKSGIRAKTEY